MIESYLELISTSTKVAQEHEILLAVQVDGRRARERGADRRCATLLEQTERVAQGLEAAEVTVLGALDPGQLARTLRTAFDPYARAELTALEARRPATASDRAEATLAGRQLARAGTTTRPTARCTPPTGSAPGRGSRSRRCSWTRCSATPARSGPSR